jgi:prepilin-type N-terminal cleavage/methylation domain-containing protein/prepilin-type processing-associated H-X9-DG protein
MFRRNVSATRLRTIPYRAMRRGRRRALTLVELLVVIGIIGVLVGLLMPAVQYARAASRCAQCRSQLKQVGISLFMYLDVQGPQGRFPDAAILPSVTPARPSLKDVLDSYIEHNAKVFACPDDQVYFEQEGLSYEYAASRVANKTLPEVLVNRSSADVWVAFDFDSVHGAEGTMGARNYLYLDGHVGP